MVMMVLLLAECLVEKKTTVCVVVFVFQLARYITLSVSPEHISQSVKNACDLMCCCFTGCSDAMSFQCS